MLIIVLLVAMGITLMLDIVLLRLGYGVHGIAYATILGYAIYGFGYLGVSVHLAQGRWSETVRFLLNHLALFIVMMVAIKSTGRFAHLTSPWQDQVFWAGVRLLAVSGILLPFVWLANRKSGVWTSLMAILSDWRSAPKPE
jgi:magnesium-transporting ATPase (P-type)